MSQSAMGRQRARVVGPRLLMDDDDDDEDEDDYSDGHGRSTDDEVDSDVEKLAAENLDRQRQAAVQAAVATAEAQIRSELNAEITALQSKLRKERTQGEHIAEEKLALVKRIEGAATRECALQQQLKSCETERRELELGIMRARDIVTAKEKAVTESIEATRHDVEKRLLAQHAAELQTALDDATRAEGARIESEEELARVNDYVEQLEEALSTARECVSHREQQLVELENRASSALRASLDAASARIEARCAETQRTAVRAAMDAAAKAQQRAVLAAIRAVEERAAVERAAAVAAAVAAEREATCVANGNARSQTL
jgi:chromosome segregation ATPase